MNEAKKLLGDRTSIGRLSGETGLARSVIRGWTEDGSLSSLRLTPNGTIYVSRSELEALIDSKIIKPVASPAMSSNS